MCHLKMFAPFLKGKKEEMFALSLKGKEEEMFALALPSESLYYCF